MNQSISSAHMNNWLGLLMRHELFAALSADQLQLLLASSQVMQRDTGACVPDPGEGPATGLYCLGEGRVTRNHPGLPEGAPSEDLGPGSIWPLAALFRRGSGDLRYTVSKTARLLFMPLSVLDSVFASPGSGHAPPGADSPCEEPSRLAIEPVLSSPPSAFFNSHFDQALGSLRPKPLVWLPEDSRILQALEAMQSSRVGSVLFKDQRGQLSGILTRRDMLERVLLKSVPLDAPVLQVMSRPVQAVDAQVTIAQAAVTMSRLDIRHLPVTHGGDVVNMVSERDLFALQQQSLRHVSARLQMAQSLSELREAADAIRAFAAHLAQLGAQSRWLTELISDLNDKLTRKIIDQQLAARGLSARDMCWVALGSEGRGEQTIATDQDNALIFESSDPGQDRGRWMDFALHVNRALDACGFPLCQGGVMASCSDWCRTPDEWAHQCSRWIEHGAPADLLKAAVFFDLRPLLGRQEWAVQLRTLILRQISAKPRFLQQWVRTHLDTGVALNWHGGFSVRTVEGRECIDLKLSGTAIVVDAARILALSQGVHATGTLHRLQEAGRQLGVPAREYQAWGAAFDFLQQLRLRQQIRSSHDPAVANLVAIDDLNLLDRQMLKAAFATVRSLQQRLQLDYIR